MGALAARLQPPPLGLLAPRARRAPPPRDGSGPRARRGAPGRLLPARDPRRGALHVRDAHDRRPPPRGHLRRGPAAAGRGRGGGRPPRRAPGGGGVHPRRRRRGDRGDERPRRPRRPGPGPGADAPDRRRARETAGGDVNRGSHGERRTRASEEYPCGRAIEAGAGAAAGGTRDGMDFRESDEQIMLRQSAAAIATGYGHDWFVRKARADERSDELWTALAKQGFIGVNTPEAYGGGGMGISELAIVCEEMAAAGCPLLLMLVSPAICASIVAPEKQYTLFFDGVRIGADRLVGTEGNGLRQVFVGLNPERIMTAAISNGIGRYALAKASAYANQRSVWGVPVGTYQGLAHPLAKAKVEVECARLMTQKAAWLYDRGLEAG